MKVRTNYARVGGPTVQIWHYISANTGTVFRMFNERTVTVGGKYGAFPILYTQRVMHSTASGRRF